MKIKLTRNIGGHKSGDTIDVTNGAAKHLIDNDAATKPDTKRTINSTTTPAKSKRRQGEGGTPPPPEAP